MVQNGLELKQFFIVSSQNNKGKKVRLRHPTRGEALSKLGRYPFVILKMQVKIKTYLSRLVIRIKKNKRYEK